MDVYEIKSDITDAVRAVTMDVFSTMLMTEVTPKESFVENEEDICSDFIASLQFCSEKYTGKIALFSSGDTACHIVNSMLGTEENEVNDDIKDGMGEIVNMVSGGIKGKLLDNLGNIQLLTPWIIAGKDITISSPNDSKDNDPADTNGRFSWLMTAFNFTKGTFIVGMQANEITEKG